MSAPVQASPVRASMVNFTTLDNMAWVVDRYTGVIYLDADLAEDAERAGRALAEALAALAERPRPTLTAVDGGGRQTKRRAKLRLV